MDEYGYIGIETLLDFCEKSKDHAVTPNDFMRMPRVNLFTIEPEPHWIPVTERLPKSNGVYIVTRTIDDGFTFADIVDACYFDGSDTWHDDTRVNHKRKYLNDIKAWMPLPEPYEREA